MRSEGILVNYFSIEGEKDEIRMDPLYRRRYADQIAR